MIGAQLANRAWLWAGGVFCLVVLIGLGVGIYAAPSLSTGFEFSPAQVDLRGDFHVAGETLELDSTLRNTSASAVQVTEFLRSCSCMAVDTQGKAFEFPFVLQPGEEYPVRMRIHTLNRSGGTVFTIAARGHRSDGTELALPEYTVTTTLHSPLTAIPAEVFQRVPALRHATAVVSLADDWPGEGPRVKEVKASSSRFRLQLHRRSGLLDHLGKVLKRRYELEIQYAPPEKGHEFFETISILVDDSRIKTIEIPFHGIIERPYEFVPAALTLYGKPGESVRREVVYHYKHPDYRSLEAIEQPSAFAVHAQVNPGMEEGTHVVVVSARIPEITTNDTIPIRFTIGKNHKAELPITVVAGGK